MKRNKILIIISTMLLVSLVACVSIPMTAKRTGRDADTDTAGVPVSVGDDRMNILITGSDRTSGLTDVIMLLSVSRRDETVSVMQIPRDTYAAYTDGSYKKLNGAYGRLGAQGMCEFISDSLGVSVDRYLMLSPDALVDVVDALGGVDITLERPMNYSDPAQGLYISLKEGRQTLDGRTAEQFIRYRSGYADGDLGRIDAQKIFMCALLQKAKQTADPLSLVRLATALVGKTETNLSLSDVAVLAEDAASLEMKNVTFFTAPGEAVVATNSGASYYSLSSKAMAEVLSKYFGADGSDFDRQGVFINEAYESFVGIYRGYSPYKVYTGENMEGCMEGFASIAQITIDKTRVLHYNNKS